MNLVNINVYVMMDIEVVEKSVVTLMSAKKTCMTATLASFALTCHQGTNALLLQQARQQLQLPLQQNTLTHVCLVMIVISMLNVFQLKAKFIFVFAMMDLEAVENHAEI